MDRVEELNNRLNSRLTFSNILEPVFDPRPNGTRGGLSSHDDTEASVPLNNYENYNPETMFAPMTKTGPYKGYAKRIHLENELRHQFFALQRSENGIFIPSSQSDLYSNDVPPKPNNYEDRKHEHNELFVEEGFANFDPTENIEARETLFNNHTQQYVKDSKIKS
tara:strand:+ start:11074 stop:11568 length:495 start_codon:yes stop_codon:yes gene_type:complete